jgi:hypothetical protein
MTCSRRDFLRTGLVGLGGLCAAAWARKLLAAETAAAAAKAATSVALPEAPKTVSSAVGALKTKTKVFEITEPKLLDGFGNINQEFLPGVLSRLLQKVSGAPTTKEAWHAFFTKDDIIAIKFDPLAADELRTSTTLAQTLVDSLTEADFELEKIMILDPPARTAALGTRPVPRGYQDKVVKVGKDRQTQFLRAMSEVTAILNVPFIKDHRLLGLAAGLTSLTLGVVNNPGTFIERDGVAELAALPEIRAKHRLTLVNAIRGIYDGGPRADDAKMWNQNCLLAGTDMVAVDRIALDFLDSARYSQGLRSVSESGRPAHYLAAAGKMGLGEAEFTQIDLRHISI